MYSKTMQIPMVNSLSAMYLQQRSAFCSFRISVNGRILPIFMKVCSQMSPQNVGVREETIRHPIIPRNIIIVGSGPPNSPQPTEVWGILRFEKC